MPTMETTVLPRFNELCAKERIRELDLKLLRRRSLPSIAQYYGAAQTAVHVRVIRGWPRPQLEAVRGLLIDSVRRGTPVTFAWEEAATTDVVISGSAEEVSILFRSPVPRRRAARGSARTR